MDVTAKFQASIPYALQSVSPALAALHTRRLRKISTEPTYPDFENSCCNKCGFYLFAGDSNTRVVRMNKAKRRRTDAPTRTHSSSSTRARQSTCLQCGWVTESLLDDRGLFPTRQSSSVEISNVEQLHTPSTAAAKSIQNSGDAAVESKAVSSHKTEIVHRQPTSTSQFLTPPRSTVPSASTSTFTKSKSRPKKKIGLHEMLARNRAKEEKEKAKNISNGGQASLAAFLDSL
ncbi:hypothetical protein J3R30DRAFT_3682721 [Lentinula aciculospora]|uniref:Uncharacterized protein n=1 Tax=Lentinula aciculospora TaxID=153920 RepID=A0A9W9AAD6_9AGAR|nr:hypothetical protein J3R30DRAFT_3682721 [Lentinula aciculospora]